MSDALRAAAPILARQQSLITLAQAGGVGINREQCRQLVLRDVWERADRGLYGPTGVAWNWRRRLVAALLVAPEGAVASHRCTAALLGVGGIIDPRPEITIPRGQRFRRPSVIVHESTDLELADRRIIDGIPSTGPRRLAMDLGGVVSEARFRHTVRELRFVHGVSSLDLLRTYLRHKRSGRNGGGALRDWLDRYYRIEGVPESGLEQLVLDALVDAALPTPVLQLWVDTGAKRYRIDIAYPHLMLAIEVDGRQHEDAEHEESDAERDAALEALGWTVVHIKSKSLATDLARAIATVRRLQRDFVDNRSDQS